MKRSPVKRPPSRPLTSEELRPSRRVAKQLAVRATQAGARVVGPAGKAARRDVNTSKHAPKRMHALLVVCVVAAVVIAGRLIFLQVVQSPEMAARARKQLVRNESLPAERGSIFDRNGRDLAISVQVPTIAADPSRVKDPAGVAQALAPVLGVDFETLERRLSKPGGRLTYLSRAVDDQLAQRVKDLKLEGVFTLMEPKRFLPSDSLALPVLGKVGLEDDGRTGLEYQYSEILTGTPGKLVAERDLQGREIPGGRVDYDPSARGDDLVLTLDRSLQYETERRLADQIRATSALGGTAVVMDTASGELLAVANLVTEVLPADAPKGRVPRVLPAEKNQAVTDVYEPGSVAKLITIAGAIEDQQIRPDQVLSVPPEIRIGDKTYKENDPHPREPWSISDIMAHSSNVGTIMIGQELGKQRFDHYLRAFGFGARTGLGNPGESPGILIDPAKYTATSMGSLPIGQSLSVTAVQMVAAYNAVANGGVYVAPRLIKATVGTDGRETPGPKPESRRVLSPQTAAEMTKMLSEVVRVGTGTLAAIDGYRAAGKTGTARKPLEGGPGYKEGAYVSSFVGFVPAEQPRLTAMVVLDEPTPIYGGVVAAPVFSDLAGYAVRELQIPPPVGDLPATRAGDANSKLAKGFGDISDGQGPATLVAAAAKVTTTTTTRPVKTSVLATSSPSTVLVASTPTSTRRRPVSSATTSTTVVRR